MTPDRDHPPKAHDQAKAGLLLVLDVWFLFGVPFLTATAAPGTVGRRLLAGRPMALGYLLTAVVVATSVPPGGHLILGGYLFLAVLRHRLWPGRGVYSFDVGDAALVGGLPGRVLTALLAAGAGVLLGDAGPRWAGPATALLLAASGSLALLAFVHARQAATDQDAVDARLLAEAQVGRLRRHP